MPRRVRPLGASSPAPSLASIDAHPPSAFATPSLRAMHSCAPEGRMCACTHVDTRSTAQPASPFSDAPHGTRARTQRVSEMTKPVSSLYHRLSAEQWPAGAVHDDKHIDLFLVRWRRHDRCQAWRREQSRWHAARHRAHHGRVRRHVVGRPWRATGTAHCSIHPIDLRVGGRMRVCMLELPQKNKMARA